ncbi:MAG: hypothetical protein GX495_07850 [Chloroflexi bacterium]|nr:hypothetical protein [Chloroflexota bacterium]
MPLRMPGGGAPAGALSGGVIFSAVEAACGEKNLYHQAPFDYACSLAFAG